MNRILLGEYDEALCTGIALALGTPEVRLTACRTLAAAPAPRGGPSVELLIRDVNQPAGSALARTPASAEKSGVALRASFSFIISYSR